jgi:uncharacterized membrane protein
VAKQPEDPEAPESSSDEEGKLGTDSGEEITDDGEVLEGEPVDHGSPDRRVFATARSFSGPLPPPESLGEYDAVLPGLAREIVDQWKGETAHRHKTIDELRTTDREAMRLFHAGEKRGQCYALLAITLLLAVVVVSVVLDRPSVGIAGIIAGGAVLVWSLRRRSDIPDNPPVEPTDLADGDEIEASANQRKDKPV